MIYGFALDPPRRVPLPLLRSKPTLRERRGWLISSTESCFVHGQTNLPADRRSKLTECLGRVG